MDPQLLEAARKNDVNVLTDFGYRFPDRLLDRTPGDHTCLHLAVLGGHLEFARKVCAMKASLLLESNSYKQTPLMLAAMSGDDSMAFSLVKMMQFHCAEMLTDILLLADLNEDTAVHHALRNGHEQLAMQLIELAPAVVEKVNNSSESVMYLAACRGYSKALQKLLEFPSSQHVGPKNTPVLHCAIIAGNEDIVKMLLSKGEITTATSQNGESETALVLAIRCNDLRMVKMLLSNNDSLAHIKEKDGLSPFSCAAREGNVSIAKEIIRCCPLNVAYMVDNYGRNALHIATIQGHINFVQFILKTPGLSKLISEVELEGNTALHLAVINCKPRIVRALLKSEQVDRSALNAKGFTALDLAPPSMKYLLGASRQH